MLAPVMNAFFMVSCSPNVQGGLAAALSVLRVVSSMPAARRRARAEHRRRQRDVDAPPVIAALVDEIAGFIGLRSEEHTSELQSLMRISYAVFCLKKNNKT